MSEPQWYCEDCEKDLSDDTVNFTEDAVPLCAECYDYLATQEAMGSLEA